MNIKGNFRFSKEEIEELIRKYKENGIKPATMKGVKDYLEILKPIIENLYDKQIFYLSYFATDAPFIGWRQEDIKNMLAITDGVTEKFLEIYALILAGLGE